MSMAEKEELTEEAFYVNLRKPLELRRHILEASKMVIFSLQNYHNLLTLREEKTKKIALLKVQVGEINLLCAKLAEFLPDYHLKVKEEAEAHLKKGKRREKEKGKKAPHLTKVDELDQLENTLQDIESKLKHLK